MRHGDRRDGVVRPGARGRAARGRLPVARAAAAPGLASVRDWYRDAFPDGEDVPDVEDCAAAFTAFAERVRIVGGAHLRRLLRGGTVVFEGAQGVLLDEWHGFHPYTTWSATTFANAETLLAEAGGTALRLGVLRAYATRHGPGPFVTEDPVLTADLPEPHNGTGRWQGAFRAATSTPSRSGTRWTRRAAWTAWRSRIWTSRGHVRTCASACPTRWTANGSGAWRRAHPTWTARPPSPSACSGRVPSTRRSGRRWRRSRTCPARRSSCAPTARPRPTRPASPHVAPAWPPPDGH
ncbi:adenylosuccinate synthetase [Actinomadura madurae]|nr:adenylosuccinate synthetase [Actinomadura madurae]